MKDPKKAKWIIGTSGVVLISISINANWKYRSGKCWSGNTLVASNSIQSDIVIDETISERERELVQLDWTSFDIQAVQQVSIPRKSDRTSRRS